MAKIRRQNAPRRLQDAHKTAQEALRPPLGRHPDAPRCLQDAPKTPQEDPKTTPRRPKTPPRWPQDAPKTPSGRPKTAQDAPRPLQDAPKPPKTLPEQRFWDDFKESLEDFWKICWKNLPSNLPPQTYLPKK